jgi:hypothetical protein
VARQPNYGQERAERQRRKAARRDARVAAKTDRRDKDLPPDPAAATAERSSPSAAARPEAPLPDDPFALVRLGQALKFVCGADHPTTLAVLRAATSGDGEDIERAHALFLELTPGNQHAALTIAAAGPSGAR